MDVAPHSPADLAEVPADILSRLAAGERPITVAQWFNGWIEWALREGCTHLILSIHALPDLTDAQRVDLLLRRGMPARGPVRS